jgi:hypothetical protein
MLIVYSESDQITSLPFPYARVAARWSALCMAVSSPVLFVCAVAPIHFGLSASVSTCPDSAQVTSP